MAINEQIADVLKRQILQKWGNTGQWQNDSVDLAGDLARRMVASGITDLDKLQFTPTKRREQVSAEYQGTDEYRPAQFADYDNAFDLTYDGKAVGSKGFIGDINRDGSLGDGNVFSSNTYHPNLLAWNSGGKGAHNYEVSFDEKGNPIVTPVYQSSSFWNSDLGGLTKAAAMAVGMYGAATGLAGTGTAAPGATTAGTTAGTSTVVPTSATAVEFGAITPEMLAGSGTAIQGGGTVGATTGGLTAGGAGAATAGGAVGPGISSGGSTIGSGFSNAANSVAGTAGSTAGTAAASTPWYMNPAVQRAGLGLATTAISNSIGGGGGADLSQANPAQLAQITQANNQNTWQQQLNASRVNSVTPEGSSIWSQSPQFNEGAYNSAMQAWQAAGNPNLPQPTREQFTTQQWTNTQTLSPQNQAIRDAQRNTQQMAADTLPWAADKYLQTVNQGANRSGIPDFQYTASTQQQGQLGANARPTYGQVSAPSSMSNPTFGDINRGGITSSAQTTARDWASTVQGDVTDWNRQLAALDPWMFDQQGSDAMYNMATRYMLPQQAAEKQALEARLGEQGFVPGTPAYETALKQILDSQGLAQADARDRALLAGREFGNQAFDNKAGALSSAVSGMLNFGDLGIRTDANAFNQNLSNAQLANAAQQQDFAQQQALSAQQFQEGLAANDVVKQLFGMNLDATNTNNKWAGQSFQDLLGLTDTNNRAIGANNQIALQLAQLNNSAVGQARGQANADFTTDVNASRTAAQDLYNAMNISTPQAPGALTSQVPGMQNADIAGMLQQYFGNNVDLQNASTAERNAIINALGQFLSAAVTGG